MCIDDEEQTPACVIWILGLLALIALAGGCAADGGIRIGCPQARPRCGSACPMEAPCPQGATLGAPLPMMDPPVLDPPVSPPTPTPTKPTGRLS